ncbi:MAG: pyruvate kinase, partial [Ignavibacteriaceae bacterium]
MTKMNPDTFAKTKILCTVGPATSTADEIDKLILAGMDGIRMNFSHGNYEFFGKLFNEIDKACKEENTPLAILVDLQGPKIRVGDLSEPEIELVQGEKIEITIENTPGTKDKISTS